MLYVFTQDCLIIKYQLVDKTNAHQADLRETFMASFKIDSLTAVYHKQILSLVGKSFVYQQ